MGLFGKGKQDKGFECNTNPDGSETCKRIVRGKDGKPDYTGEEMTIDADPSDGCKPYKVGNMRVMDDEMSDFDKVAKRVAAGCKRKVAVKPGLSAG